MKINATSCEAGEISISSQGLRDAMADSQSAKGLRRKAKAIPLRKLSYQLLFLFFFFKMTKGMPGQNNRAMEWT